MAGVTPCVWSTCCDSPLSGALIERLKSRCVPKFERVAILTGDSNGTAAFERGLLSVRGHFGRRLECSSALTCFVVP